MATMEPSQPETARLRNDDGLMERSPAQSRTTVQLDRTQDSIGSLEDVLLLGGHVTLQLFDRVGCSTLVGAINSVRVVGEGGHEIHHGQKSHNPEDNFHNENLMT